MYTKQVADHIANPRNVGQIENPSGLGDVTNTVCMDRILLTIRVDDEKLTDARVQASGCPPTLAAASALTELIVGRPLKEVYTVSRGDIVIALGRLPSAKMHCAVLAIDALRAALDSCRSLEE
jgi:NifU-like protein involved in Fe-S cluster formation